MKAWVFLLCFPFVAGCSGVGKLVKASRATSPSLEVAQTGDGPVVTQRGDAVEPARVVVTESKASIPVPAGSVVTVTPPPGQTQASDPVTVTTKTTDIQGPRAFTPPAPPTASDIANADAITRSYYLSGALVLAASFLFWRGHVKASVVAVVSAIGIPIVANVAGQEWAQRLFIAGACIAGALFAGWHFVKDKNPTLPDR